MRLEQILFCEMARNEVNGQLSLIGLYPGDLILIQRAEAPLKQDAVIQLLPNLSCVVILGGMERVTALRYQLQVKHGTSEVLAVPPQAVQRPAALPFQNLLFAFSPFPCTQGFGDYEFRITVEPDSAVPTTYSKRIKIQQADPQDATRH